MLFVIILVGSEILIRAGLINRFIVPLPSEVLASFGRVIVEEDILHRFLLTAWECLAAGVLLTVFGVAIGVLLYGVRLVRQACETWVAAIASAPLVLAYPLFLVLFGRSALTIIMLAFVSGLPPVILKTIEGLSANAARAAQCRAKLQAHAGAAVLEDLLSRRRCRRSSSASGSA